MAAARLNIPTIFVSGGPMLAGRIHGGKTSLSTMFEAVGSYSAGKMTEDEVEEYARKSMSDLWILFRNVYREFNELLNRSHWYGDYREMVRFQQFIPKESD